MQKIDWKAVSINMAQTIMEQMNEIERLQCAIRLIAEHPVEQSQQWEVGAKEMLKLARSTHSYKP